MFVNLRTQAIKNSILRFKDPKSFVHNFSYNFLANVVLIVTQLLLAPLLTRFYPPESYGTFTSIFAIALNIASLLTLRYEYVILIESRKTNRDLIARLLVLGASVVTGVMLLLILLAHNAVNAFFTLPQGSFWILCLPVLIFLQVFFQVTGMEITLMKKYKENFIYGSSGQVASKGISLAVGKIWHGHFAGMLLGDILLRLWFVFFRVAISLRKKLRKYFFLVKGDLARGIALFKKYRQFPLYEMPAGYINLLVSQSHLYFLTFLKEKVLLGLLGVTFTVLDAPMRLLSYSISPVLMQKIGELKRNGTGYSKFLTQIFLAFYAVCIIPLILSQFWAQDVFSFVFGAKWAKVGVFVSAFLLFYFFRIEVDIYENLVSVTGFNRNKFLLNIINGVLRVGSLLILYFTTKDIERSIIIWGHVNAVVMFFTSVYYSQLLGIRSRIIMVLKICLLVLGFGILYWHSIRS